MFKRKITVRNIEFGEGEAIVTLETHLGADNTYSTHVEYVDVPDQGGRVDLILPQAKRALLRFRHWEERLQADKHAMTNQEQIVVEKLVQMLMRRLDITTEKWDVLRSWPDLQD